jgi:hypothetical protein
MNEKDLVNSSVKLTGHELLLNSSADWAYEEKPLQKAEVWHASIYETTAGNVHL